MPEKDEKKEKEDKTPRAKVRASNQDEKDEQDGNEDSPKKSFLGKWINLLIYTLIFFLFIFLSFLISIFVVKYEKSSFELNYNQVDLKQNASEPKDIYEIPEFKLALDKNPNDVMTTIVQVKIVIGYEKGNQQILNEIIQRKEQIKDRIQYVIAGKSYDEINTAKSRDEFLKEDLLYSLNSILNGEILDIYFDTFVISRIQSR